MLMNTLRRFAFLLVLAMTVKTASADYSFRTYAAGVQEGRGVETKTTATLDTSFSDDFSYLQYALTVTDGVNITQAHYHCAPAGENGPVVAFLFGFVQGGVNVKNGRLSRGRLYNADIATTDFKNNAACGVTIVNIASLYAAIKLGRIYVNVHTVAFPAGEVRGQVV